MSGATAVYSTASLAESRATMYKSMAGKVQQPLLDALQQRGYEYMTPVQEKVLTELPSFSSDCLVQAKTGTGKTVAFLLPTLNRILQARNQRKGDVSVLIISPTRELAMQIKAECDMLTARVRPALECHTAFGGTKKEKHLADFLSGNPTVLVATPGRLNDYLSDEHVASKFSNLQALILDEADTMLEAGFLPAITEVLRRIPPKSAGWQGMCFSATVPEKIKPVLGKVLKPGYTSLSTVDPNEVPTIEAVDQYFVIAPTISDVLPTLAALIEQERAQTPNLKAIVFGATANGVGLLYDLFVPLVGSSIKVHELHSRLSQSTRTRTTDDFKKASAGLMFASDVIGRGMDFPNVDLVIQVGLPSSGEQYVHRVGRTARAGTKGRSVILLTDRESYFLKVNKQLPIKPYTGNLAPLLAQVQAAVERALSSVDETAKAKAYQAFLGFNKTFTKQLRLDNTGLVELANEYAAALGCPEPPMIDKQVVGKMGLKGVRGLNVGQIERKPHGQRGGRGQGQSQGQGRVQQNGGVRKIGPSQENGMGQSGRGGAGGGRGGQRSRGGRGGRGGQGGKGAANGSG